MIPFNRTYIGSKELQYVSDALLSKKLAGDNGFTKKATTLLEALHKSKVLLTTSCTDALEMSALLLNIGPEDEVILPSYTFVSTALAFIMRGAKIVFADSEKDRPHMDMDTLPALITGRTKAIVPVHYAGEACDMDKLMSLVADTNIRIIEDNAQGITSTWNNRPLGTFGALGTLSFHDSKNIVCGEGGALIINDQAYAKRAEIIREKGTNRSQFFRGEVDKYNWVDVGSSYLPSDILAAVLCAQLEDIDFIQQKRLTIYKRYIEQLSCLGKCDVVVPKLLPNSQGNGHAYYIVCKSAQQRTEFIEFMRSVGVYCVFHYLSLHKSPYFKDKYNGAELVNADRYTDCLVRLPLYGELADDEVGYIIDKTKQFFGA